MLKNLIYYLIGGLLVLSSCSENIGRNPVSEPEPTIELADKLSDNQFASIALEKGEDGYKYVDSLGETWFFPNGCGLSENEIREIAYRNARSENEHSVVLEPYSEESTGGQLGKVAIRPGDTENHSVWTRHKDNYFSSTNGFRRFDVWVRDNKTKLQAEWWLRKGTTWHYKGREMVSGAGVKKSRSEFVGKRETFRLKIVGKTSSRGKRRICYYSVHCDRNFERYHKFDSKRNIISKSGWFQAGPYQRWYYTGCSGYLVVNDRRGEILVVDAFASKSSVGRYTSAEKKRLLKFINILRKFVSNGYSIIGFFLTHEHFDHVGDFLVIYDGLKKSSGSFLGGWLHGRPVTGSIPVIFKRPQSPVEINKTQHSVFFDQPNRKYFIYSGRGRKGKRIASGPYIAPSFPSVRDGYIDGETAQKGTKIQLGSYRLTPYIWYHNKLNDKSKSLRVLGFLLEYAYDRSKRARTLFLPGGAHYPRQQDEIKAYIRRIYCHHVIHNFLYGDPEQGKGLFPVRLLSNPPYGKNMLIASHVDNLYNAKYDWKSDGLEVSSDLFGSALRAGIARQVNSSTYWHGARRNIWVGAFANRTFECSY